MRFTLVTGQQLPKKVLIVDDEPIGLEELKHFLELQQINAISAPDVSSAIYLFNTQRFEVVIISIELKEVSGLALFQKIKKNDDIEKASVGIILMSTRKEAKLSEENLVNEFGGIEIISKPFKPVQILPMLARTVIRSNGEKKYLELKEKVVDFHRKTGNVDKAITAVKNKMPELGRNGPNLLVELYEEAENYDNALSLIDALIDKDPDHADIKLIGAKGRVLMKMGELEKAAEMMEKADDLAPKNLERMSEMIDMYLKQDAPDKSVDKMKEMLQLNPENPDMKFDMFEKLKKNGYDEHAISFCRETTSAFEVVRFYNNRGVMDAKKGNPSRALEGYKDALKYYPSNKENYRIHFNIALSIINEKKPGHRKHAIEELEKSLNFNPDFDKAKTLLAKLTEDKKHQKNAS